jgi:hypothetical protein
LYFKITPSGKYTVIHQFVDADGNDPYGLLPYTGGPFYGVTSAGGTDNLGTVFDVSVGLKSFVELLPTYGKVGKTIDILGQGLTGTTGTFKFPNRVPQASRFFETCEAARFPYRPFSRSAPLRFGSRIV